MRSLLRAVLYGVVMLALSVQACSNTTEPTAVSPTFAIGSDPGRLGRLTISPSAGTITVGAKLQLMSIAHTIFGTIGVMHWTSSNPSVATVSNTGLVTGVAAGVVTIRGTKRLVSGTATITISAAVPPTDPPALNDWTFCVAAGSMCEFLGLRDVRLGATGGPYVQQTAYHIVPCATYGFNNQNPAPGRTLHCDYGPIKTTTLTNPMPGMAGLGALVRVPVGSPGAGVSQMQPGGGFGVRTDGSGSFRTTCSLSKYAFDDPIVYPGQPGASHLHMFFGNTAISASSTAESVANSGNSTCRGGTLNRTGYWVPALFDANTGEIQLPDETIVYYKTGFNMDPATIRPFPSGLRMIAGDKNATTSQEFVMWGCSSRSVLNDGITTSCSAGDSVTLTIVFPQCWDGQNLDAADHKSHMAYPTYRTGARGRSTCPSTHPIPVPEISEIFTFPVTKNSNPAAWRLTSDMYSTAIHGGYSAHADWIGGWDATTMQTIVSRCLNKGLDCGVGGLGDGRSLF